MTRSAPLLLIFLLWTLPACGGRSGLQQSTGSAQGDNKIYNDFSGIVDIGPREDARPRDTRPAKDSCLPIPASQVKGPYAGVWSGQYSCSWLKPSSVSGDLSFTLTPGGATTFQVKGSMNGTVAPGMTFKTNITGVMGCTALSASLPVITVGSGGGVLLTLSGQLRATFEASSTRPSGFPNGSWSATETNGCKANGTWKAAYGSGAP